MTTYAEALAEEQKEQENSPATSWVDSNGNALAVGSRVRVSSEQANGHWNRETLDYVKGREFDFGEVVSLNEDGIVSVIWDSAGCGCDEGLARNETPSDLTVTNESEIEVYYLGSNRGYQDGQKDSRAELREALGIHEKFASDFEE